MITANHLSAAACELQPDISHRLIFHSSRGLNIYTSNCIYSFWRHFYQSYSLIRIKYFVAWQIGRCRWMRNKGDACESKRWIWTLKWFNTKQQTREGHYTMQALGFALCSNSRTSTESLLFKLSHINTIFNNTELTHSLFISRSHSKLRTHPPLTASANSLHESTLNKALED